VAGKRRLARCGAVLGLFTAGAALGAAAAPSAYDLAGRYTHRFTNGDISGARYTSTDRVDIVPLDRGRAYFDVHLAFFNGHQCAIDGIARLEGRALVYRNAEVTNWTGRGPCTFRIWREGRSLRLSDGGGSCTAYCGARGSLGRGRIAWSSRRPIGRAERVRILRDHQRRGELP
jgi:hypothetical protein